MTETIPLFKTFTDENDVEAVAKVLRRGSYWAIGPEIEAFEQKIAAYVGKKYALAFNSGTSALHTLLVAHNLKGKEVIIPSFTFVATANAVLLAGAVPVFAESEPETFGLDVVDVEKRITPRTAAIIDIQYGGIPARDTEKINNLAKAKGIIHLSDAAESLGAKIGEKQVTHFCDSAIYSFCQNKVLATGEGGMLVTDDKLIYEKAKLLRSHGRVELVDDYFSSTNDNDYIEVGYNYRMPSIIAALGLSQFEKLEEVVKRRRERAEKISAKLSFLEGVTVPQELLGNFAVYQMYTIQLRDKKTRDGLQKYLKEHKIMSKVYFNPVHLKTIYKQRFGCKEGDLPTTEVLSSKVLNIPLFPVMTDDEIDRIITAIQRYINNKPEGKKVKNNEN